MELQDLMTINDAMEAIEQYSIDSGVDSLTGIERMVKSYKILTPKQRLAVDRFMVETKLDK